MARRFPLGQLWIPVGIVCSIGLVWDALGRIGLPDKYFFDSNKIAAIARGDLYVPEDKSFQQVGDLYRLIGLGNESIFSSLVGMFCYGAIMCLAVQGVPTKSITALKAFATLSAVVLGATFLGGFSKEFFQLPWTLAVLLALKQRHSLLKIGAVSILYGLLFRQYWVLVGLVLFALGLALKRFKIKRSGGLLAAVLMVLALIPVLLSYANVDVFTVRTNLNLAREMESFSVSTINWPLDGSGFLQMCLTRGSCLAPLPSL